MTRWLSYGRNVWAGGGKRGAEFAPGAWSRTVVGRCRKAAFPDKTEVPWATGWATPVEVPERNPDAFH